MAGHGGCIDSSPHSIDWLGHPSNYPSIRSVTSGPAKSLILLMKARRGLGFFYSPPVRELFGRTQILLKFGSLLASEVDLF